MKKTKYIAFSAMMASLGVVILFLGSLIELMDLTAVLIASVCIFVCGYEMGAKAIPVYVVTAIISFLILPSKLVAVEYALFGLYPVLKIFFEKAKKPLAWFFKVLYIVISVCADILLMFFVFMLQDAWYFEVIFFVLGVAAFILYDIVLSRLTLLYKHNLRHRLRIDRFFGE